MNQLLMHKILRETKEKGSRGIYFGELCTLLKISRRNLNELRACIAYLVKKGEIIELGSRVCNTSCMNLRTAVVTRLNKTFGFVKFTDDETEAFVPGKFFLGAMPGDKVLTSPLPSRGSSPEAEVVRVVKEGEARFTGKVLNQNGVFLVKPDSLIGFDLPVTKANLGKAQAGDKVLCEVYKRGESHKDHKIRVILSYGDSGTAVNCSNAILDLNGIKQSFPPDVMKEAGYINERGITKADMAGRTDLRNEIIFTIDSADTKDIDDAISLKRTADGYELGVHIADVSHYVQDGSALDDEAFNRGTSIYFADRVVPMLPPELSNGICSLNENEDRLAFSCIVMLDKNGLIQSYKFQKTIIRSRVKGVYKEINSIIDGSADKAVLNKYSSLIETITLMVELSDILTKNKQSRGAPEIETSESYIILDENHHAIDVVPRTRGKSEVMIEEFMLTANEAAAAFAKKADIPFVYRVHEPPTPEKIEGLKETLSALGISTANIKDDITPATMADILSHAKDKDYYPIVNTIVLRSMSKAKYYEFPIGHFGLVLEDYAQFTSPIRRYPDLTIHRILSDAVCGIPKEKLFKKYDRFAVKSSRRSTETELNAMKLERQCDDIYKAEYMSAHLGEEFEAIISGIAPHGIYAELYNTVEGLIKTDTLPGGEYDLQGVVALRSLTTKDVFRIGDKIRVKCVSVDVSCGNIDFVLA